MPQLQINPVTTLNSGLNTPRSRRNLQRQDYAQMDNLNRAAYSRSASPAPTNRRPDRSRSPRPSICQDTITPSESASNISRRIPDIMNKSYGKKPRTG
jgi:hypothetical protein